MGRIRAQPTWVTALCWTCRPHAGAPASAPVLAPGDELILVTACCEGSVRLLGMPASVMGGPQGGRKGGPLQVQHLGVVRAPDLLRVHCLDAAWLPADGAPR